MDSEMHCHRCTYVLTYSDRLLCRIGTMHYCPRCWARIDEEAAGVPVSGIEGADRQRTTSPQSDGDPRETDDGHTWLAFT